MKIKMMSTFAALAALAALATGCESWGHRESHHANSLYQYLYADRTGRVDAESIPVLSLPLRVGIAFVPSKSSKGEPGYFASSDVLLSENKKMELMKQVGARFKSHPFIKSIEYIPSTYLTAKGGFANLEQLRAIYGVDVIVLLSFDQVQFTDEGLLSLSYWTIVGAYVVQAEKNDTQTMLDGAVYDIASHKLLFRAPGLSKVTRSATPVNLQEQLRRDRDRGFDEAATNLVTGLTAQLDEFKERVKNAPTEFKVVHKPGYAGASGFGEVEAVLAMLAGGCYLWTRPKRK